MGGSWSYALVMLEYRRRDILLKRLGFKTYSHYLGSELWKSIRSRVLSRSPECLCGKTAAQVHHRSYAEEVLLGRDLTPLLSVCFRCHKKIEFTVSGIKRTFQAAEDVCLSLISGGTVPRTKTQKICKCGNRAVKKSESCRPCLRFARLGMRWVASKRLPMCKGKDCVHQARRGTDFCRIHELQPDLSLRDHYRLRKKLKKC